MHSSSANPSGAKLQAPRGPAPTPGEDRVLNAAEKRHVRAVLGKAIGRGAPAPEQRKLRSQLASEFGCSERRVRAVADHLKIKADRALQALGDTGTPIPRELLVAVWTTCSGTTQDDRQIWLDEFVAAHAELANLGTNRLAQLVEAYDAAVNHEPPPPSPRLRCHRAGR